MNSIIIKDKLTGRVIKFWTEDEGKTDFCEGCCFNNTETCDQYKVNKLLRENLGGCSEDDIIYKAKEIRR